MLYDPDHPRPSVGDDAPLAETPSEQPYRSESEESDGGGRKYPAEGSGSEEGEDENEESDSGSPERLVKREESDIDGGYYYGNNSQSNLQEPSSDQSADESSQPAAEDPREKELESPAPKIKAEPVDVSLAEFSMQGSTPDTSSQAQNFSRQHTQPPTQRTSQTPGLSGNQDPSLINPQLPGSMAPTSSGKAAGRNKKGTATSVKRGGGRSRGKSRKSTSTKQRATNSAAAGEDAVPDHSGDEGDDAMDVDDDDEDSDDKLYCICRGPDDHRWMIECDSCKDWFHGDCVDIEKFVGENYIEQYICPNCQDEEAGLVTWYKATCALQGCLKVAKQYDTDEPSYFCSEEHQNQWWQDVFQTLPDRVPPRPRLHEDGKNNYFDADAVMTRGILIGLLEDAYTGPRATQKDWKPFCKYIPISSIVGYS